MLNELVVGVKESNESERTGKKKLIGGTIILNALLRLITYYMH